MTRRPIANLKNRHSRRSITAIPKAVQTSVAMGKRLRGRVGETRSPFIPPEDWHEPTDGKGNYSFVVQPAGSGYQHVVTESEIRDRLAVLPPAFVAPLEVIQLSRMTRKKQSFPCYGMQWGTAIYLYPVEKGLVEHYGRPPRPAEYNEARAYGGQWVHDSGSQWKLVWTANTIRDFYLNNVLIHELGHLLDQRNTSYRDRERFAEWFAIEHGYRASRKTTRSVPTRRRHRTK